MNALNKLMGVLIISLFVLLIYHLKLVENRITEYSKLHESMNQIISLNKEFSLFINSKIDYKNYDEIQVHVDNLERTLALINSKEFEAFQQKRIGQRFEEVRELLEQKVVYLQRSKSFNAIMNNSFRYIQSIYKDYPQYSELYTKVLTAQYNKEINIKEQLEALYKQEQNPFIKHSTIFLEYFLSYENLVQNVNDLNVDQKLFAYNKSFDHYALNLIENIKSVVRILASLFVITLIIFFYNAFKLARKQVELNRFKEAVESSDNIVLITDKNKKIRYVNHAFEKLTGYSKEEVQGHNPSIFNGGQKKPNFYQELNETIYAGKKWKGEFINRNKKGELVYEKASITPILNDKGEIEEFLAIKLDITEEIETLKKLQEKEHLLAQQSKMVAMGEMLESIAHQWRQPLSTISTAASGLRLNKEYQNLSDEQFDQYTKVIIENTGYLSTVIDNFKDFFKTNHDKRVFTLKNTFEKVQSLVGYKLNNAKINYHLTIDEVECIGLENELIQALANIINNANDALCEVEYDRHLFVKVSKTNTHAKIVILDNAGGIPSSIIEHVFEPYYTTKHQSQGTGIGLYMTYEIISKHFHGSIALNNKTFDHDGMICEGCEVMIKIPLKG